MKTVSLAMLLLVAACDAAPAPESTTPTEAEVAVWACQDLVAAQQANALRCGHTPEHGYAIHFVDCSTVTGVADVAALYDTCLPALASSCFEGDTPPEIFCHQLEF